MHPGLCVPVPRPLSEVLVEREQGFIPPVRASQPFFCVCDLGLLRFTSVRSPPPCSSFTFKLQDRHHLQETSLALLRTCAVGLDSGPLQAPSPSVSEGHGRWLRLLALAGAAQHPRRAHSHRSHGSTSSGARTLACGESPRQVRASLLPVPVTTVRVPAQLLGPGGGCGVGVARGLGIPSGSRPLSRGHPDVTHGPHPSAPPWPHLPLLGTGVRAARAQALGCHPWPHFQDTRQTRSMKPLHPQRTALPLSPARLFVGQMCVCV